MDVRRAVDTLLPEHSQRARRLEGVVRGWFPRHSLDAADGRRNSGRNSHRGSASRRSWGEKPCRVERCEDEPCTHYDADDQQKGPRSLT